MQKTKKIWKKQVKIKYFQSNKQLKEDNMSEEKITIDSKEYKLEDFDDKQKYLVAQIRDLTDKSNKVKFQLDQIEIAKVAFIKALTLSIEEKPEVENEDGTET